MTDRPQVFRLVHDVARNGAVKAVREAPQGHVVTIRAPTASGADMSDLDKMFARDIELHGIKERESDALTMTILGALREGLTWPDAHDAGYFRDSPEGITELEGEYDLAFVAKVIRASLP